MHSHVFSVLYSLQFVEFVFLQIITAEKECCCVLLLPGGLEEILEKMKAFEESLRKTTDRMDAFEDPLKTLQKIPHRMCALERSNRKLENNLEKINALEGHLRELKQSCCANKPTAA